METATKSVTIYSTPTCPFCHMAKEYFKANNIEFTDKDASVPEVGREMIERSHQMGVPVIYIGDEQIIGFDRPRLAAALGLAA